MKSVAEVLFTLPNWNIGKSLESSYLAGFGLFSLISQSIVFGCSPIC